MVQSDVPLESLIPFDFAHSLPLFHACVAVLWGLARMCQLITPSTSDASSLGGRANANNANSAAHALGHGNANDGADELDRSAVLTRLPYAICDLKMHSQFGAVLFHVKHCRG